MYWSILLIRKFSQTHTLLQLIFCILSNPSIVLVTLFSLPLLGMFSGYGLTKIRHWTPVKTSGYIVHGIDFSMHHHMRVYVSSAIALMSTTFEDYRIGCAPTCFPTMYHWLTCIVCFDSLSEESKSFLHSFAVTKLEILAKSNNNLNCSYDLSSIIQMTNNPTGRYSADIFGGYQVSGIIVTKIETCVVIFSAYLKSATAERKLHIKFLPFTISLLGLTRRDRSQDA